MKAGRQIYLDPVPTVEETTTWIEAGSVTIGVEYRIFNTEILQHAYPEGQPAPAADEDSGVSIHVLGSWDGFEYLRFDCFVESPHYHYLHPKEPYQFRVPYDEVADGPMLDWTLGRLRNRLVPMLEEAGARELAADCGDTVSSALDLVERTARRAQELALRGR
jgi:hypothetical protein